MWDYVNLIESVAGSVMLEKVLPQSLCDKPQPPHRGRKCPLPIAASSFLELSNELCHSAVNITWCYTSVYHQIPLYNHYTMQDPARSQSYYLCHLENRVFQAMTEASAVTGSAMPQNRSEIGVNSGTSCWIWFLTSSKKMGSVLRCQLLSGTSVP